MFLLHSDDDAKLEGSDNNAELSGRSRNMLWISVDIRVQYITMPLNIKRAMLVKGNLAVIYISNNERRYLEISFGEPHN